MLTANSAINLSYLVKEYGFEINKSNNVVSYGTFSYLRLFVVRNVMQFLYIIVLVSQLSA
jgi:hypothetical protein